ncbi:MAG: histidinol dehydrogenase [Synergistaceae bacterium]|nr:histidinol dehydrogenase [Synergistaceae bacterium]
MRFLKNAKERSRAASEESRRGVADIIDDVRANGDEAVLRYNMKFDGSGRTELRVSGAEIEAARREVPERDMDDIRRAARGIRAFAEAQMGTIGELPSFSPSPGVTLGHRAIPVESCCCYVPGGGYPLYSTALMLVIPAKVAGVSRVAACSPPMRNAPRVHPYTLAALDAAGADEIYTVGGAHGIAAFSYGTGQIAPVDLIVGPGNNYVTEAKRQCYGQVGIDFAAGPSEVLIIADGAADAGLIASDLLAQSEHDRSAKGTAVVLDEALGRRIMEEAEAQLASLETAGVAGASWRDYGEIALAGTIDEAIAFANERAPEHLELHVTDGGSLLPRLRNYGSLFIGRGAAEVFGDYVSGTNHTLPTQRAARYTGGVWVGTFLKICTHQTITDEGAAELAPIAARMARGEGLIAHARSAERRIAG